MLIKDYKAHFLKELSFLNDPHEAESFFYLILKKKQQLKRVDLALQPNLVFTEEEITSWNLILNQLKQEVPIQHILESTSFCGLDFLVNKNVLIPRPETEELVDWILDDLSKNKSEKIKILDIGTGSGCIAICLAKNNNQAIVDAIDISNKALAVAKNNAALNNTTVTFEQKDILKLDKLDIKYNIIVSNPPYVRLSEKNEMNKNVLEYEPHLALFVSDEDALVFYEKIAQLALKSLTKKGKLYFEINQYLGQEMTQMLKQKGFKNIQLKKDIYNNERMIRCNL